MTRHPFRQSDGVILEAGVSGSKSFLSSDFISYSGKIDISSIVNVNWSYFSYSSEKLK